MKIYLAKKGEFYSPKNKLEEAIQNFIQEQDRKLIKEDDLEEFKNFVVNEIEKLNNEFPRCTPVKVDFWNPRGFRQEEVIKDWYLTGVHSVTFHLLSSREVSS